MSKQQRRNFLKTIGTAGLGSLLAPNFLAQTSDDKIMMFFWIALFFAIFCGTFLYTSMYGKDLGITTDNEKLAFDIITISVLFGISWYTITYFA